MDPTAVGQPPGPDTQAPVGERPYASTAILPQIPESLYVACGPFTTVSTGEGLWSI